MTDVVRTLVEVTCAECGHPGVWCLELGKVAHPGVSRPCRVTLPGPLHGPAG